jgi:hypothetical protein
VLELWSSEGAFEALEAYLAELYIVPEARGRGLGLELVRHAQEEAYGFVGALGANSATLHVLGGAGFVELGMHRWARVFDPDKLRELLAGREYVERPPPAADEGGGFVGACRDDAFVEWRYRRHPRFRYEVVQDASGFAAYRIEQVAGSDARIMRITDLLGGASVAESVVEAAERERVVFADFYCTSPRFGRPLAAAGFGAAEGIPGRFQPLDFSDRPLVSNFWAEPRLGVDFAAGALYVTRADSDLDRPN